MLADIRLRQLLPQPTFHLELVERSLAKAPRIPNLGEGGFALDLFGGGEFVPFPTFLFNSSIICSFIRLSSRSRSRPRREKRE